jgi:putative ABC transport system permease protein
MEGLGKLWRRFLFLFQRKRLSRDLEEEMRFHLESQTQQNCAAGMDPGQARYAARRRFGNTALLKERSLEIWGWSALDRLLQDLKLAGRAWRGHPWFTAVLVLTLAFGIGVNTAIFSAVNALLIGPYPFPQPERIVILEARHVGGKNSGASYRDFLDWQQQSTVFDAMAILPWPLGYTLTGMSEPERVTGGLTTAEFMKVLGIEPMLGRFFTKAEDRPGAAPVAVLTYAAWRQRFAADPGVLGRVLMLDGQPFTIIGVLPRRFALPGIPTCEFFTALRESPANGRNQHQYVALARLRPGVSLERAQTGMNTIARRLEQQYPATNAGWRVGLQPMRSALAQEVRTPVLVLFAAVGLVLLLACLNVSGLLLARVSGRAKEIAVRASVGAGRGRIVRQMLTETVLLSLGGGALGLLLGLGLMNGLRHAVTREFAFEVALPLDGAVLAFTFALSLLTGMVSGLLPAWRISGVDPNSVLKDDGNAWSRARSRNRLMSCLVAAEVALSLILMAGAGLLMKRLVSALRTDPGFHAAHVLTFAVDLPAARYTPAGCVTLFRNLLDRLRNAPGVETAAAVSTLPMTGAYSGGPFRVDDEPEAAGGVDALVQYNISTPGYFRALGIPLLRGRDFDEHDSADSAPVGIVNDTLARRFFPGQDPIGHRYRSGSEDAWRVIVGVVASVKHQQPTNPPVPGVFYPHAQRPDGHMWITVRARGNAAQLAQTARAAVHELDPDLPLLQVRTMSQVVADSMSEARMLTWLLSGFAAFALGLAVAGIYGIVDYSARQSTREAGIRLALGASYGNVVGLALRKGTLPAGLGVALGVPAALAAATVLRALLFGISPHDLTVFLGVPLLLLLVALGASFLPARRAAKADIVAALHWE